MRPLLTSFVALLSGAALSQPASAQVTPEDVWAIYRDFYSATGLDVAAIETRSGDTLTLSEITGTIVLPEGLGTMSMILGPVDLTAQDDGSVSVSYAQPTDMRFTAAVGPGADRIEADVTLTWTQDATILATGTPDEITITADVRGTEVALTDLTLTGDPEVEAFDTSVFTMALEIGESVSATVLTRAEDTLAMEIQSLTGPSTFITRADLRAEADMLFDNTGSSESATYTGRIVLPAGGMDYIDMAASIRAGFAIDVATRAEGMSTISISEDSFTGETRQIGSTAFSDTRLALGPEGLAVDGSTGESQIEYTMAEILPFPISLSLAGSRLLLETPLLASETPQAARLAMSIEELAIDDRVIRLIDPSGLLPRDPISFELDLTGQLKVLTDLVDFLAAGEMIEAGTSPVEPTAVALDAFGLSGAGVNATASGSFTLDMTDDTFLDGLLFRPAGSAEARATGVNGLIDTLVTMGLLTDDDAMIGRMGVGMFSRNMGDDTLESSLEVTPEGSVLVNGNRIR